MNSNSGGLIGLLISFGVASGVGFFAMAALMVMGDWTFLQALFAAGFIFIGLGTGLALVFAQPLSPPVKPGSAGMAYAAPEQAAPAPSAPVAPVVPEPVAEEPAVIEHPAAEETGPEDEASETPDAAPANAAPETTDPAPAEGEDQPEILTGPRNGQEADDLKRITGVGPKLEGVLNELGFYHFDQIAAWTPAQVAWVDARLTFKGRIERDDWISQAKVLAGTE